MAGNKVGTGSTILDSVSAADAAAEKVRSEARAQLETELESIDEQRKNIVNQLRSLGGKTGRRRSSGPRASNDVSLISTVASILSKAPGPMGTTAVCDAVRASGYNTGSENFRQMVSQSLSRLKGLRMGNKPVVLNQNRGEWQAGSGMKAYLANPEGATKAPKAE